MLGLNFEVSHDGSLTYVPQQTAGRRLVWVDRQGNEEPIAAPDRQYTYVQISPDGSRLALDIRDGENDIWIWDLARQVLERLTFDKGLNRGAVWSPDGRRVAFSRSQDDGHGGGVLAGGRRIGRAGTVDEGLRTAGAAERILT